MKKIDSLKEIKDSALKRIIRLLLYELFFGLIIVLLIFGLIGFFNSKVELEVWHVIFLIIMLVFSIFMFREFMNSIIDNYEEYKNPEKNERFLRYGSPEKVNRLTNDVLNKPIYNDEKLVFNNKFILEKSDLNSLCALEDIIAIYKFTYKRNGQMSKVGLKYHDKFGKEYAVIYSYLWSDVDLDKVLKYLIPRCKNARFGYTKETLDYVKNYRVAEPTSYNNREIKDVIVAQELVNDEEKEEEYDEEYDEDLEDMYDREEYDEDLEEFNNSDEEPEDTTEEDYKEDIDENDEFFKEEFEFSYAKVKEVLKKLGYDNYVTFKKEVYESKKIKRKKFEKKENEVNYLVKALGYEDFEDFYNTNIENDD